MLKGEVAKARVRRAERVLGLPPVIPRPGFNRLGSIILSVQVADDIYFEVPTPLGVWIRTTREYWERIVTFKHPAMRGREEDVIRTLREPHEIRRSKIDPAVFLYYAPDPPYWICVVAKHMGDTGFVVTVYRTDRIKEGELVWRR
jgi:hypothetical protein